MGYSCEEETTLSSRGAVRDGEEKQLLGVGDALCNICEEEALAVEEGYAVEREGDMLESTGVTLEAMCGESAKEDECLASFSISDTAGMLMASELNCVIST
jgi:hypothetical protein